MNSIPSGRQLARSPPLADVKRDLDFSDEEPNESMEQAAAEDRDENNPNCTFDSSPKQTTAEQYSHSMLKGMKGYQLTLSDLEFIKMQQGEKLLKQLERDLEEVKKLLKKEQMAADLVFAFREKAQAELQKFPSCEELTEWVTVVLNTTMPSADLDQDLMSLLALVTEEDVQRVTEEKRRALAVMEKMVENKRKKEAEEREQLEKQMASEQLTLQALMSELSDLKSELLQQEEACEALEKQTSNKEAAENGAEKVDSSEASKSRAKERQKAVKSTEKMQSKSTRSKLKTQSAVKEENTNKKTSETLKSGGVEAKRRKVKEKESSPRESKQAGLRKPPAAALTQSKEKPGRQEAAAGAVGLRRSKRIASRS